MVSIYLCHVSVLLLPLFLHASPLNLSSLTRNFNEGGGYFDHHTCTMVTHLWLFIWALCTILFYVPFLNFLVWLGKGQVRTADVLDSEQSFDHYATGSGCPYNTNVVFILGVSVVPSLMSRPLLSSTVTKITNHWPDYPWEKTVC